MFLTPIVLSTVLGLAFGGLGSAAETPDFAAIRVAVVNLDEGYKLENQLPATLTNPSLLDLEFALGDQTVNLGEQLLQNQNLNLQAGALNPGNFSLQLGDLLAAILLSQPLTTTALISGSTGGFDLTELPCPLLPAAEEDTEEDTDEGIDNAFTGSLDELLNAVAVNDPALARAGVARGDYAAAVIIPPGFSAQLAPSFALSATAALTPAGAVEVFANNATPISAAIVRAIVEGIAGQLERVNVALSALVLAAVDTAANLNPLDLSARDLPLITRTLQNIDTSLLEPVACLMAPGAGNLQIEQQPLDQVQARSSFGRLMVVLGGSQAVFFALFTGVFGINSIYEDRRQGTLQRLLVTPTPGSAILAGKLLGNLLVVMAQLLVLLLALTAITTLVERELTFIWGANLPALLLVVLGLSLFTTGLGVLIVGLAQTPEQVQVIGPLITILLGALGGSFALTLPLQVAQFSPIWWGIDAMSKLAANELDIGLHLLVLFSVGIAFASLGAYFFRRRIGL
jgi:ABC-2 type transport system permease protein